MSQPSNRYRCHDSKCLGEIDTGGLRTGGSITTTCSICQTSYLVTSVANREIQVSRIDVSSTADGRPVRKVPGPENQSPANRSMQPKDEDSAEYLSIVKSLENLKSELVSLVGRCHQAELEVRGDLSLLGDVEAERKQFLQKLRPYQDVILGAASSSTESTQQSFKKAMDELCSRIRKYLLTFEKKNVAKRIASLEATIQRRTQALQSDLKQMPVRVPLEPVQIEFSPDAIEQISQIIKGIWLENVRSGIRE